MIYFRATFTSEIIYRLGCSGILYAYNVSPSNTMTVSVNTASAAIKHDIIVG